MATPNIILPTEAVPAETKSPELLIIFSKPKVGKTSNLAQLPNNLILDLERGSRFTSALKIEANSINEIYAIGQKILEAGKPYKYITVDTMTRLEDMCIPYAEKLYSDKAIGKNWFLKDSQGNYAPTSGKKQYGDILNLPKGAGYVYLREAVTKIIEYIKTWAPRVILCVHVRDNQLEKTGAEFSSADLDLTGKIKRILSSQSDAIGYLYRRKNQNILSFLTTDEVACGARPTHLMNKEIVLSEIDSNGVIVTHWDKIFID